MPTPISPPTPTPDSGPPTNGGEARTVEERLAGIEAMLGEVLELLGTLHALTRTRDSNSQNLEGDIKSPAAGETSTFSPKHVVDLWNSLMAPAGFPTVRRLTNARRVKINTRLGELPTREKWIAYFRKIAATPFLRGDKGWRADFDWAVRSEDNWVKTMEGGYGQ